LFSGTDDPVLVALRNADIEGMKPEEVVEQVRKWQRELRSK
jgi:hypothetical protein